MYFRSSSSVVTNDFTQLCGWSLGELCSGGKVNILHCHIRYSYHKDEFLRGIMSLKYVLVPPSGVTGCLPREIHKVLSIGASNKVGHKWVLQDFAGSWSAPTVLWAFPTVSVLAIYSAPKHWRKGPNSFFLIFLPRVICLNQHFWMLYNQQSKLISSAMLGAYF